jgi:hydroxymethylpyrimidine/phosphomethylpyrimidine kinase
MTRPIVISIGTTHPWNVAGVGRDLIVGAELGVRVFTAVAGVSAQDAGGVRALQAIDAPTFATQLLTLPWNAAGAVRVGALVSPANVRALVAVLHTRPELLAVVDPVLAASRGGQLAGDDTRAAIRDELAASPTTILTPNLSEAVALLGVSQIDAGSIGDAARALQRRGAHAVLLKGGHLNGEPVDALATASGVELFSAPRIAAEMHGTGCTLAMALASELAKGIALREAVIAARDFVRAGLAAH